MSGENDHCPFCGDDMCDGRCYDALLDRLANAGIDLVAKDRRIVELEAERNAAFAISGCECGAEEACCNLAKLHARIADLEAVVDNLATQYGCTCGHAACKRCQDTRDARAALEKASKQ